MSYSDASPYLLRPLLGGRSSVLPNTIVLSLYVETGCGEASLQPDASHCFDAALPLPTLKERSKSLVETNAIMPALQRPNLFAARSSFLTLEHQYRRLESSEAAVQDRRRR